MTEQARGLLLVMMDIDPEHEADFNRWYNEEHVPERLAIPGFVRARRFRALSGEPRYLALYELKSPNVLHSDDYLHFLQGGGETEWTRQVLARVKNFVRNVYVEILDETP